MFNMPSPDSINCPRCGAALDNPEAECENCLLELGFSTVMDEPTPDRDFSPTQKSFGDYELLDEIARGGMGVVYRARQQSLDRTVALKLILGGQLATKEFVRRFRTEASAAAALQHSHIVAIHDVGVHEGNHFLSMDYVEGQNLSQLVGNQPLSAKRAARYLKSISAAIQHAHDQGILHRDLKPSNILVDSATDEPRVTDFGLAKRMDGESSLTVTGQILGSPYFMPPEQADHKRGKVGRVSDVYGLGAILYYLLTARPPFQGESLEATIDQVLNSEPVSPHLLNPSVPKDLETICLKCLHKEQDRRYETAKEVGDDLSRFLEGEPIQARPTSRLEKTWRWCRRKPAVAGLLTVATISLLAIAIGSPIAAYRIDREKKIAEANLYGADLNTVQTALTQADLLLARELLDKHRPSPGEPDRRGFEWRYLWMQSQSDAEFMMEPVVNSPRRVLFSPDGRFLAAGNNQRREGQCVVWNLDTKTIEKTLPQGNRPVVFFPHSPTLVTAGIDGLHLWNTRTWEQQRIGPCHQESVAKLSPDGRWLVVYGNGLQVWDTRNWNMVSSNAVARITYWTASTLAISHDSSIVSCGDGYPYGNAARLFVFRIPSLEKIPWSAELPDDVCSTAFHPSRDLLLTGNWSGDIELWDTKTGRMLPSEMKQNARVKAVTFDPTDPGVFATTGGDRSVRIWNFESQRERMHLHGATQELEELDYSPDGQTIATGGLNNPITLWDATKIKSDYFTRETEHQNMILGYSSDQSSLLTVDDSGQLMYRDSESFAVEETLLKVDLSSANDTPPYLRLRSLRMDVSTDHNSYALGTTNGTVEIWNIVDKTSVRLAAHSRKVREVKFSPEGDQLATVGEEGEIHLWDIASQERLASAQLEEIPSVIWPVGVRFSPTEDIITVTTGGRLLVFQREHLKRLHTITNQNSFASVRFSPDGRYFAASQFGHYIRVWDTENWVKEPIFLRGHQMLPYGITFSPDGRRMVTGSDRLVIWDTATWQQLARLELPIKNPNGISFTPDGNVLVTADSDGIRAWRATSFEEISKQESEFGRWK